MQKGKLGCTKGYKGTSGEQQGHIGGGCSRASWDALGMQWDRRDAWREAATLAGTCWGMAQIRAEPHWGGAAESTGVMLQRWRECTEVGRMHRRWQRGIGWSNALEMRGCIVGGCSRDSRDSLVLEKRTGDSRDATMTAGMHWVGGMQQRRRGCTGAEHRIWRGCAGGRSRDGGGYTKGCRQASMDALSDAREHGRAAASELHQGLQRGAGGAAEEARGLQQGGYAAGMCLGSRRQGRAVGALCPPLGVAGVSSPEARVPGSPSGVAAGLGSQGLQPAAEALR